MLAGLGAALVMAGCAAGPGKKDAPPSPAPTPFAHPWGPSPQEVAAATRTAAAMSPRGGRRAGHRRAAARHRSPRGAPTSSPSLHLAGVMITGSSVASLEQVRALSAGVHAAVAADGRDWPGLVSTDNEGGAVQRMSGAEGPWTTFPPFAVAGRAPADVVTSGLRRDGAASCAPPGSPWTGPRSPTSPCPGQDVTIGSRSAGTDPARVSGTVVAAVEGFLDGGVLPAVKHFPGHGSLTTDSHEALPVQDATAAQLRAHDLPPFRAAVDAGVPMVMMGHVDVTAWDRGVPASVSPQAYRVLREDLGFSGVTVTDSLGMGALGVVGGPGEVAVAALKAGADLLLNPADNVAAHAAVVAALEDGTLDRDRVDEAAGRVIALLRHQGELAAAAGTVGPEDVGSAAAAAEALQEAGKPARER